MEQRRLKIYDWGCWSVGKRLMKWKLVVGPERSNMELCMFACVL